MSVCSDCLHCEGLYVVWFWLTVFEQETYPESHTCTGAFKGHTAVCHRQRNKRGRRQRGDDISDVEPGRKNKWRGVNGLALTAGGLHMSSEEKLHKKTQILCYAWYLHDFSILILFFFWSESFYLSSDYNQKNKSTKQRKTQDRWSKSMPLSSPPSTDIVLNKNSARQEKKKRGISKEW